MKRCTICGESKALSEFHRQATRPDGLGNWCKPCKSEKKRAAYLADAAPAKRRAAEYRKAHPEKAAAAKRKCYQQKREHYREKGRQKYVENREEILQYWARYRAENRNAKNQRDRAYVRDRLTRDPLFRLTYAMRNRIFQAFRDKAVSQRSKTSAILGCDWETLRRHIEHRFTAGMSWDNYGAWHVDHIVPLASASDEAGSVALCHYLNLQPLWAADNIRKGAKIAA